MIISTLVTSVPIKVAIFFNFFITNMELTKCKNNTIDHRKIELCLIIKEFRELISLYRFIFEKKSTKILRRALRKHEKMADDKNEDNIEYLKDQVNSLKDLKNVYLKKDKYHNYNVKYFGSDETIRYLFKNDDEDYNVYKLHQQYQSFSGKTLLPLNEYLKRIRSKLTKLITKNCEVKLSVNFVFGFLKKPNDEYNVFIESNNAINIDEIFDQLIK